MNHDDEYDGDGDGDGDDNDEGDGDVMTNAMAGNCADTHPCTFVELV